ncbi:MAG: PLP-dependent aminotransferase family protein [Oscillospiraceae bacterium]|nr:PLP-dependent aminotransferase family protein [Oscillospiraceae bacterium]
MSRTISDKMANLKPSAVREILKVTSDPSFIAFAAGNPSAETFDVTALKKLCDSTLDAAALQYGVTEGYPPLREMLAKRYGTKYGLFNAEADDVIVTAGGQQVINLVAQSLLNEGDAVICENPSFVGALNTFRAYNAKLVGVHMDGEGMLIDRLEAALKAEPRAKLIYTIPTFQNPGGTTMPVERRKQMLELAKKYDVMILEDSPYFELSFGEAAPPAIKSLDTDGYVIFAGSFSKIVSPGIRVGFSVAPKWISSKMTVAKQNQDVHTNGVFQRVIYKWLRDFNVDAHIAKCAGLYKKKSGLMLKMMDELFDKRVTYTRPAGGLFLWCDLPEGYNGSELAKAMTEKKVAIVPGTAFDVNEDVNNRGFRLNYSVPSEKQIETGITILADGIRAYLTK